MIMNREHLDLIGEWALRILALAGDLETGRYNGKRISKGDIRSLASEIDGRADCIHGLVGAELDKCSPTDLPQEPTE